MPSQEPQQGALSSPRCPHDGHALPGADIEVEGGEDGGVRAQGVGEGDVGEDDAGAVPFG